MHKGATTDEPHGTSRQGHGRQSKAGVPIEKENIPFVDSDHEDDCFDDGGDRLAAAISSRSTVDQEYDIMTESQENLARAYITGRNAAGPSLAERRMQEKLTVSIDTSSNDGWAAVLENKLTETNYYFHP